MAYVSQEFKKEVAPKIKELCKKYGVKGTLAVRNHSTLVLNIKSAKLDFLKNVTDSYFDVNCYHIGSMFEGKEKEFLEQAVSVLKSDKYFDHSDSMTDYFHCSHYVGISVGQWNKPFVYEGTE